MRLIAAAGADLQTVDGYTSSIDAWTPPGRVWSANFCHSVVAVWDATMRKEEAWADLAEQMAYGTEPCTDPGCDTCNEAKLEAQR